MELCVAGRLVTSALTSAKECYRRSNGGEAEDRKWSRKHSCMIEEFLESLRQSCVVSSCESVSVDR